MKYLLLFIIILASSDGFAQKMRLTDTSNRWTLLHREGIVGEAVYDTYMYKMGGDTLIKGHTYRRVEILDHQVRRDGPNSGPGNAGHNQIGEFFREDTILNRVYCITTGDTTERLIYDDTWQVGDSAAWGIGGALAGYNKIIKRDSIYFDNNWYHVFLMTNKPKYAGQYAIVEGMGTVQGTAHATYPLIGESTTGLLCFQHAGITPSIVLSMALGNFDNAKSCSKNLSVAEPRTNSTTVEIVPNPGGGEMYMNVSTSLPRSSLKVFDSYGRIILSRNISGTVRFPVGSYLTHPGVYFYSVENGNGSSLGKIFFHQ